jgi:hypothetical protein
MVETLIAAGIPALFDLAGSAGSAISRKWIGVSVDDQIRLQTAEVEKLRAMADLNAPGGEPSRWVIDLRASFRYLAALLVIITGGGVLLTAQGDEVRALGAELLTMPFAFIFGERMTLSLKGLKR